MIMGAVALSMLFTSSSSSSAQAAPTSSPPTDTASTTTTKINSKESKKASKKSTFLSPEELDAESRAALSRFADEKAQKQLKRGWQPSKGGKLVRDPMKSRVPDPTTIPPNSEIEKTGLQSAWRVDKLKDMTYTQFWNLIGERKVEKAKYSGDRLSISVTTKATAPGGARTEKVGLPFDPDLFDHMIEHGYV